MKWLFIVCFLLFLSTAIAHASPSGCEDAYNKFLIDQNKFLYEGKLNASALFETSQECSLRCGDQPGSDDNGLSYSLVGISCNDFAKKLIIDSNSVSYENIKLITELDKNSAIFALVNGNHNVIAVRYNFLGASMFNAGQTVICKNDLNVCPYIFDAYLNRISYEDTTLAKNYFRGAVDAYYYSRNQTDAFNAFVYFNKTRTSFQRLDLVKKTSSTYGDAVKTITPIVESIFGYLVIGIILLLFVPWYLKKHPVSFLEKFTVEWAIQELPQFKISPFEPPTFLGLVAALWIGSTIGYSIVIDVINTNIQTLSNPSLEAIYELTHSGFIETAFLVGNMHIQLWLFLLLTMLMGILWWLAAFAKEPLSTNLFKILSLSMALVVLLFAFLVLDLGVIFWGAIFVMFPCTLLVGLIGIFWADHLNRRKYVQNAGNKTLHLYSCKLISKIKDKNEIEVKDSEILKMDLCRNCFPDKVLRKQDESKNSKQ